MTVQKITPFAPWPYFAEDEVAAAAQVLRSGKVNYWTGEECRLFEQEFAAYLGCRHAIALANGTLALELALHAFDIGAGDEVITTSRTFIASAGSIVLRGATPVFADVDANSQNLCLETLQRALTPKTRAIIAVHLAGWPCEMDAIMDFAEQHGLVVIEDCAQAHGATYQGRPAGSLGHAAAFSFCQDKIMTTGGEGGMLILHDEARWKKAWAYKDHGKSYDAVYHRAHPAGFRWLHESFGSNWRMTEMQAAIGRLQLKKLPDWIKKRREHAAMLSDGLAPLPGLRVTIPPAYIGHAYYKYYAFVKPEILRAGWDRDRIMAAINQAGIPCFSGSCSEVYLEKAFDASLARPSPRLAVAQALGETSLMFLVHPTLTRQNMLDTVAVVTSILSQHHNHDTVWSKKCQK
ncbi:MAG: DegT/DnrJ/EryC1/StrS aminotransferase family protein [Methylococcaceae bacterium]|nr:MAG: DegT/DnrJ/EryC1/StrS aminotransferase family protein [Methylococcaceae bacterium]